MLVGSGLASIRSYSNPEFPSQSIISATYSPVAPVPMIPILGAQLDLNSLYRILGMSFN